MKTFFYILFFFSGDPEPQLVNGWFPVEAPSMEECRRVAEMTYNYVSSIPDAKFDSIDVGCMEAGDVKDLLGKLNEVYHGPTA